MLGPFASLAGTSLGYWKLLGMNPDAASVLRSLSDIVGSADDSPHYIRSMLADCNWRSHMIAIGAIFVTSDRAPYASALWATFDSGSWVAPQLAVTLYYSDADFIPKARRRINARCPVDDSHDLVLGDTRPGTAKNLGSLLRVLAEVPSEEMWAWSELHAPDVSECMKHDLDSAGDIAGQWLQAIRMRFGELGWQLQVPR